MTPDCIKQVHSLQNTPEFAQLTIEQLLYACIHGAGFKETAYVMYNTEWSKYCPDTEHLKLIDCRKPKESDGISIGSCETHYDQVMAATGKMPS